MQVCTMGDSTENTTHFFPSGWKQFGPKTIAKIEQLVQSRGQKIVSVSAKFVVSTGIIIVSKV